MVSTRAWLAASACLIGVSVGVGGALAQTPPAPAPAAPPPAAAAPAAPQNLTVITVDVQELLQTSKAAKSVRQQIEAKRAEYQKELSHQEEVLNQEGDALQRQQGTLTADQFNARRRDLQGKFNDFKRDLQAKSQALERSNAEAMQKVQNALLLIVKDIATDRKANLVFQRTQLVLFDHAFDVTDQVLQKLDEQLPTLTVDFVAPAAANAPVEGGAAAPAPAAAAAAPAAKPPKKK